jgi:transposase
MAKMRVKQVLIDKLTHEMTRLKRLKFAAASEAYTGERQKLLFETIEIDLEALSAEIEKLAPTAPAEGEKRKLKHAPLPASLPRRDVHHEPDSTTCSCGRQLRRIGDGMCAQNVGAAGMLSIKRRVSSSR